MSTAPGELCLAPNSHIDGHDGVVPQELSGQALYQWQRRVLVGGVKQHKGLRKTTALEHRVALLATVVDLEGEGEGRGGEGRRGEGRGGEGRGGEGRGGEGRVAVPLLTAPSFQLT